MFRHCRFVMCALAALLLSAVMLPADEPFDYFRNSWNVIGLRDYEDGSRVTPDNRVLLAGKAHVQMWFGRDLVPLSRRQTKTLADGWMPIVLLQADDGPVRYNVRLWATPLPTVADWQAAFDWPTEGENFLDWIKVDATNTGSEPAEARFQVEAVGRQGDGEGRFEWSLEPGGSAQAVVRVPFAPVEDAAALADADADVWLDRTESYWKDLMAGAATIEVPCRKATEALRAAHVCQLIANDHGELQGGEGFYDNFYIRDGGYQIMELEEAGLGDAAEKAVGHYLRRQREDGRFETQKNQFDANGQAVWVLWQYYKITGDREWLAGAYPQMRRAADWTMAARREARGDSPFAGLLPAAPADGEYLWDGKHHILGYDFWNLRGLLCTADAARALGRTDEAEELSAEAAAYREAIDAASKRIGTAYFPPSWEVAGTHWGNTETLWPTPIFPADDPRVAATIGHARNVHGGGFIEGTIQWLGRPAIHPYMSAYTTMASLARGEDEQVVEDFYWYLLHSTAAHAFPEGIFQRRRFAWSHTIPHVTGASNYALMLRHMLVHEQGDELHLLAAVPAWWLGEGQEINVQRAPTHFGEMSFTVRGTGAGVEVDLSPPTREPPKRTILHLPKSRPLVGSLAGVEVAVRDDQKKRWDFPTVVATYLREAAPLFRPIPGLALLPLAEPRDPQKCRMLDLAALANTDPFTAPFGVPNPGKFLFTGLPTGEQTVAGIPFRILDPAQNGGRGLVVLHSQHAPADCGFPREVEIPVGARGRRLYFLGNVCGWTAGDEGSGDWPAVAEYVIHYADGRTQAVPWILDRTADDWAARPAADEVVLGPHGDPWHLNVVGVELRPVPVEKITFRDLGTPSAPLLAAVTMEE